METSYNALSYEYRLVLTIRDEAQALYGPDHRETLAASARMAELKVALDELRNAYDSHAEADKV